MRKLIQSHKNAINGILSIFKNERNFRIHILATILVITGSILLNISHQDWIVVGILITLVLVTEAINTAIEALCDSISLEYNDSIKYAKDICSGAVLLTAILSVILGLIIYIPYITNLMQ